ncbi:asparagine synthetase B family protein, partial [Elusimicrobiota bacterium]
DVLDHAKAMPEMSEEEIAQRVLRELRDSVQVRKVSDVPVGVFLSGGIDSSTNAALFSEGENDPIKTFTIGYKGDYKTYRNESYFAEKMAGIVKSDHHEKLLTQDDLLDFLPDMVYLQDEPIADPVCVPIYYVSKLARDHGVIVCQVGEGADELFWGYPRWKEYLRLEYLNRVPFLGGLKGLGLSAMKLAGMQSSFYYELLRRGASKETIFWGGAEAFPEGQKKRLISDRLKKKFSNFSSWQAIKPYHDHFMANAWEPTPLNWMSYLDLKFRLPELLLMRVDKMSMGVSLEGRVPFLDHEFVTFAMSIPESIKTKNGTLKYILKKAVNKTIPDELIHRRKQGFGVPVYEWFFDRLGDRARSELNDFCDKTDFLDRNEVMRLFDKKRGSQLWFLLNFAMWWKRYIEN